MAANDESVTKPAKARGARRTRFCRECEFSCTDSLEFTEHQTHVHREVAKKTTPDTAAHIRRSSRINQTTKVEARDAGDQQTEGSLAAKRRSRRRKSGPETANEDSDFISENQRDLEKRKNIRHSSESSLPGIVPSPKEKDSVNFSCSKSDNLLSYSDLSNCLTGDSVLSSDDCNSLQISGDICVQSPVDVVEHSTDIQHVSGDTLKTDTHIDELSNISASQNLLSSIVEAKPMTEKTVSANIERPLASLDADKATSIDTIQTSPDSTSEGVDPAKLSTTENTTFVSSSCVSLKFDHSAVSPSDIAPDDTSSVDQTEDNMSVSSSLFHQASIADSAMARNYNINNDFNEDDNDSDLNEYDSSQHKVSPLKRSGNIQTRNYVCVRCSFDTTSAKKFLHHQVDCHRENFSIYECDLCEYATKYKQKLPRHHKVHVPSSQLTYNSDTASGFNGSDGMCDELNDSMDEFSPTMVKDPRITDSLIALNDSLINKPTPVAATPVSVPSAPVTQRRNPRQEVDPGKYVIVNSDKGVKYACSKCTSVYSWRKSLNKHWKEKHPGEVPDMLERSKKMAELEESNNLVNANYRPSPHTPSTIPEMPSLDNSFRYTPTTAVFKPVMPSEPMMRPEDMFNIIPPMPKIIGPFITNTAFQPAYSKSATDALSRLKSHVKSHVRPFSNDNKVTSLNSSALDLSKSSSQYKESIAMATETPLNEQVQPLDFSMKSKPATPPTKLHSAFNLASQLVASQFPFHVPLAQQPALKPEPIWVDDRDASLSPFDMDPDKPSVEGSPARDLNMNSEYDTLQCNRCSFKAKTLADYSTHMGIHLSKRAYKCAECQDHFVGVDDLNSHFAKNHAEKILEHREVLAKANNNVQQYSVLDGMRNTGNQGNAATCGKNLKCTTCGFVAKWPAELQKHSVSHSEERPFICMVCGSTYKWKWDLVKHFEKSHHSLPNPYKRRDPVLAQLTSVINGNGSLAGKLEMEGEPAAKKQRMSDNNANFLVARYLSSDISQSSKAEFIENLMNNNQEKIAEMYNVENSETSPNIVKSNLQFGRPISENTQKAVSETLRLKLSQSQAVTPVSKSPLLEASYSDYSNNTDCVLPYRCPFCEYRARWPSEITQHMKNHSNEKPFRCPRCAYRSKWKWDVVKHLKRCGGGTVKDVIDTTKDMSSLVIKDESFIEPDIIDENRTATPESMYFTSLGLVKKEENDKSSDDALDTKAKSDPVQYKAIINEGKSHCLACPFKADSKAELNKHMILHSENKPFACGSCGYCSKWKGDVKKHLKAYSHTGIIVNPRSKKSDDIGFDYESNALKRKLISSNGEETEMYKCTKCRYITSERFSFIAHSRIHMHTSGANPKLKCKQCDYVAADLTGFLTHRMKHSQLSGSATMNHETDAISQQEKSENEMKLKHRRKAIGQYKCSKCPYVCFKESNLILHLSMHEPRDSDSLKCSFCDYNVSVHNSSLLTQHMHLHDAEFSSNAAMTAADDEHHAVTDSHATQDDEVVSSNEDYAPMKCEWCSDTFQHLYQLYEHAQVKHPLELSRQTLKPQHKKTSQQDHAFDSNELTSEVIFSKKPPYQTLKYKNMAQNKQSNKLQCHKCPFVASNMFSYFRHIERHGSNGRHKCFYCDYSIDRLNLLYQHMKGAHLAQYMAISPPMFVENNNNVKKTSASLKETEWNWSGDTVEVCYLYGKKFYKCSKCEYISNNAESTVDHYQQHDNGEKYKCDLCPYGAANLKHMYQHMKTVHLDLNPDLQLAEADMQVTDPDEDRASNLNGEDSQTLSCFNCSFTTQNNERFVEHLEAHDYNGRYNCKNCSFSADQLNTMNQHSKVHQSGIESITVRKDKNKYASSGTTKLFQKDDKITAKNNSPRIRYRCSVCPYFTFCRNNLLKHRRQHIISSKYKCTYCNYSAMRWYLLQQHLQFHNSQDAIEDSCYHDFILDPQDDAMAAELAKLIDEKSPMKKANIMRGEKTINISSKQEICQSKLVIDESDKGVEDLSSPERMSCSECAYQSLSHEDLESHSRYHGANLRYRCDACSYSQSFLNLILQHRKLHSNEPGFKPDNVIALLNPNYNGFVMLGDKEEMSRSEAMVADDADTESGASDETSGSPAYACSLCEFSTTSVTKFHLHKAEHNEKKYPCSRCKWSTDELEEYYGHCDAHINESRGRSSGVDTDHNRRDVQLKISANKIQYGKKMVRIIRDTKFGFSCHFCPHRCTKRHEYLHHRLLHRIISQYTCTECNFSVNCWNLLRQHIELHADITARNRRSVLAMKDRIKCRVCPYHVHRHALLERHTARHVATRFACELCEFVCAEQQLMRVHVAQAHSMSTGGSPNTPDSLLKVYEPPVAEISSDKLYFSTIDNKKSASGTMKTSPQFTQGADDGHLPCPYCKVMCENIPEMRKHIQTHFGMSKLDYQLMTTASGTVTAQPEATGTGQSFVSPCPSSSSMTSGVDLLSPPIKTKIYLCQYCDREFEDKNVMRSHEKQHMIG